MNKYHEKSLLQTNFLEPTVAVIPCMGSGDNARLGKKLNQCSYLEFEDFNKLVVFRQMEVPTFVEDLIDYLSNGLLSVNSVEEHLSMCRLLKQPSQPTAGGHYSWLSQSRPATVQEYIAAKNKEKYGHSVGKLPLNDTAKRKRLGQRHTT